ncbi:hypothetical protein [Anaeromyxobacter oryzisoli]|uniref:hypothetical protein n=1 Tax=Anaeromyxobacter oryzisoli TaxID=2925408 RepID=UPI001F58BD30|nr:hypothetical protein [Anaeromyxobacter sp. SG63]
MRSPLAACLLTTAVLVACAGGGAAAPEPLPRASSEDPRAVLSRFVGAVEAGRWAEAHALLSARWRQAYTSGRLAADYAGAGPSAREAAGRAAARLEAGTPLRVAEGRAVLPVGPDREAVLVAEDGGWRVDALE